MHFSRIALNSKRVAITYRGEHANQKDKSETNFTSPQRPKAEFVSALEAFKPFVHRLVGTTGKWMEDVTVTAVHISEQRGGRRGVMISAMRPIADTNAPFVFTTPIMIEPGDDDTAQGSLVWPEGLDEALTAIQKHAAKYIAGDREQGDLFEGPIAEADDETEEGADAEDREPAGVH